MGKCFEGTKKKKCILAYYEFEQGHIHLKRAFGVYFSNLDTRSIASAGVRVRKTLYAKCITFILDYNSLESRDELESLENGIQCNLGSFVEFHPEMEFQAL
jgi:hypothetical protein